MESKAYLSFRSRSKDTASESMKTNGKGGKIDLILIAFITGNSSLD